MMGSWRRGFEEFPQCVRAGHAGLSWRPTLSAIAVLVLWGALGVIL